MMINIFLSIIAFIGISALYAAFRLIRDHITSKPTQQWILEDEYHRGFLDYNTHIEGLQYYGTIKNKDSQLYVTLHSKDPEFEHPEYSQLFGKHVRVTIEVIE